MHDKCGVGKRVLALEEKVKSLDTVAKGRAKLRAMILKGMNSGPGIPITKSYWKEKRAWPNASPHKGDCDFIYRYRDMKIGSMAEANKAFAHFAW